MAGARRQDDNVAGRDLDLFAVLAADPHCGAPARHAQCLVNHRVIMRVGKNAVAPHIAPAVFAECLFDPLLRIL